MLNRLPPKAVWWISLIGMLLACTLLVIAADRSDAATGVATKSEYRQLRNGMTYAQVVRLFNAPRHKIASSPYEVLVVGNPSPRGGSSLPVRFAPPAQVYPPPCRHS